MAETENECVTRLREAVRQIDEVLVPWGFQFQPGECGSASAGDFANGYYVRGPIRIRLIWRDMHGLGCVLYEFEEERRQGYLHDRTTWGIGHPGYMRAVGRGEDCALIERGISSVARHGNDVVAAFLRDLRDHAAATLATENAEFAALVHSGYRRYQVL